ncbi:MAG: hypothetical protein AAF515_05895 [Pseudomonadota bacterium]
MAQPKPPLSSPPAPDGADKRDLHLKVRHFEEADIRAAIARISAEFDARRKEPRRMPSSVMRAYQATLDKYHSQLRRLTA